MVDGLRFPPGLALNRQDPELTGRVFPSHFSATARLKGESKSAIAYNPVMKCSASRDSSTRGSTDKGIHKLRKPTQ